MLVSLTDMKNYLGVSGSTQDAFLTDQLTLISDVVEAYCGRRFEEATYIQTWYVEDSTRDSRNILTYHFPIISVDGIEEDGTDILADVIIHKPTGTLTNRDGFFGSGKVLEVEYTAGYSTIPPIIQSVVKTLVEERYNKKMSGISLNFGSDVQRLSIPGVVSVDFDYSLTANERTNAYGSILGSQANILDQWRSERVIIGQGQIEYVG